MYLLLHALCLSVVITCVVIVMLAAYVVFCCDCSDKYDYFCGCYSLLFL